jgi:hypothetical protein
MLKLRRDGVSLRALDSPVRRPALLEHVADVLNEEFRHLCRGELSAPLVPPLEDEVDRMTGPSVATSEWGTLNEGRRVRTKRGWGRARAGRS